MNNLKQYLQSFKSNKYTLFTDKISQDENAISMLSVLINGGKNLLIAPPSTGKTYSMFKLVEKGYKIIFLTHTQDLAKQTANSYREYFGRRCQCLLEGRTWDWNITNNSFIVSVWDSFSKIPFPFNAIKDFKIVIDEAHNSVQTMGYRDRGIKILEDFITNKDCLYITATPIGLHPSEFDNILYLDKTHNESATIVEKGSRSWLDIINKITDKAEGKVFCLFNSKGKSNKIDISLIKNNIDYNTMLISSENTDDRSIIQNTFMIPNKHKLIISTEVMCDGVNILNKDITDIIVCVDNINHNHIIQFIRRCRLVTPNIWIIMKNEKSDKELITWDYKSFKDIKNLIKKMSVSTNYLTEKGNIDKNNFDALRKAYQRYYNKYGKVVENETGYSIQPNINSIKYWFYFILHRVVKQDVVDLLNEYGYKVNIINSSNLFKHEIELEEEKINILKFSDMNMEERVSILINTLKSKEGVMLDEKSNKEISMYKTDVSKFLSKISQIELKGEYFDNKELINRISNMEYDYLEDIYKTSDNTIQHIRSLRKIKNLKKNGIKDESCVQLHDLLVDIWKNRDSFLHKEIIPMKEGSHFMFKVLKDKNEDYGFYFLDKKSDIYYTQEEAYKEHYLVNEKFTLEWKTYESMVKTIFITKYINNLGTKVIGLRAV